MPTIYFQATRVTRGVTRRARSTPDGQDDLVSIISMIILRSGSLIWHIIYMLHAPLQLLEGTRVRSFGSYNCFLKCSRSRTICNFQSATITAHNPKPWMLSRSSDVLGLSVAETVTVSIFAILTLILFLWFCIWLHHREQELSPATLPPSPGPWSQSFSPLRTSIEVQRGIDVYAHDQGVRHELRV